MYNSREPISCGKLFFTLVVEITREIGQSDNVELLYYLFYIFFICVVNKIPYTLQKK